MTPIRRGDKLLSWGYPFGRALCDIDPGEWIRNDSIVTALAGRDRTILNLDAELPVDPNFSDQSLSQSARVDQAIQAAALPKPSVRHYFTGYDRGDRGFGTRNYVIVLAVNSHASAAAVALARKLDVTARSLGECDGVVPVAHTEGGGPEPPNNRELIERTIVGFLVHPNVAAAVVLDHPEGAVRWSEVIACADARSRRLDQVPIIAMTAGDQVDEETLLPLLRVATSADRCEIPASELNIALQCGGSDAFSGISGNPLAGAVAREVIAGGGAAILAETDELIGAEQYILSSVADRQIAADFLARIERFKAWVDRHGQSMAGNPSGGNKLRGLYNITLKSIGAAAKKAPDVSLSGVVDYSAPVSETGLHFMDSPGNDLESIAGQVASGANLIFFVTGNGSITNFPFVPTIKFVTTTQRYELLEHEMDVNAGRYLDGEPMDALTEEVLQQTLQVASGEQTKGEIAGHSQVSIWRDWAIGEGLDGHRPTHISSPTDEQNVIKPEPLMDQKAARHNRHHHGLLVPDLRPARGTVGLIAPTSLCSGQVAGLIAVIIEKRGIGAGVLQRVVALPHTEGCGSGGSVDLYTRTLIGHVLHPTVATALLLEHGCENTHNDHFRSAITREGQTVDQFGWASIQLDGGIAAVTERVANHFTTASIRRPDDDKTPHTKRTPVIGLIISGFPNKQTTVDLLSSFVVAVVASGASIVAPVVGPTAEALASGGIIGNNECPSMGFAEPPHSSGLHLMASPTAHIDEIIAGLVSASAELIIAFGPQRPIHAHPFVPVLQVTDGPQKTGFDLVISNGKSISDESHRLNELAAAAISRHYVPKQLKAGMVTFQVTRGKSGISL